MRYLKLFGMLLLILMSCDRFMDLPSGYYTIPEGKHQSQSKHLTKERFMKQPHIYYTSILDESCIYPDLKDKRGINKLVGIGFLPHHHKNSMRVGWEFNPKTKRFDLYAYWYVNEKRDWKHLVSVAPGESFSGEIYYNDKGAFISINDKSLTIDCETPDSPPYLLTPWFGGNAEAPHEMKVYLEIDSP